MNPAMSGCAFTICTECKHLRIEPGEMSHIWHHHYCKAYPVTPVRDPFNGQMRPGVDDPKRDHYDHCRDHNDGQCERWDAK